MAALFLDINDCFRSQTIFDYFVVLMIMQPSLVCQVEKVIRQLHNLIDLILDQSIVATCQAIVGF